MSGRRYQRGASSVIAMLVASGAMMAMLAWYIGYSGREMSRMNAIQAGREFAQVTSAIRTWIGDAVRRMKAYHGVDVEAVYASAPSPWLDFAGLEFLRDCANPGSDRALLDCSIARNADGSETPYGTRYTVQVRFTPGKGPLGGHLVEVRAFYSLPGYMEHRAELAGVIADAAFQAVAGQDPSSKTPTVGSYYQYAANVSEEVLPLGLFVTPDLAHLGKVNGYARNDPTKDAWLRVDGSNWMLDHLNVGGHNVVNAEDIEAKGNGLFQKTVVAGSDIASFGGNIIAGDGLNGNGVGEMLADNFQIGDVTLANKMNPLASQGIYDVRMVTANVVWGAGGTRVPKTVVSKPDLPNYGCPAKSKLQIFVVPTSFSSGLVAHALHAVDTKVDDKGDHWLVGIDVLTADPTGGWKPSDDDSLRRAVVFLKCA